MNMTFVGRPLIFFVLIYLTGVPILAQAINEQELEEVVIVGVSPLNSGDKILGSQSVNQEDLARAQSSSLTDFLDQNLLGITVNQAQNNPLQPDLQYRGFSASSSLGLQQGITVYQNGVRINEPFGDTVNWDLLAKSTISNIQLVSGVNPLFGLNSLGGSLIVDTKTGFTSPGNEVGVSFGSFSRKTASVSFGGNTENFGHFFSADIWDETGWRDFSDSQAINLYGALSWRFNDSELDIFYNHGDTDLTGNGSAPIELLELSRSAVFTHPDITENNLDMINIVFKKELRNQQSINANVFYRVNETDGFNGDGTTFSACEAPGFTQFLCFGDDDDDDDDDDDLDDLADGDTDDDDALTLADIEPVFDQNGDFLSAEFDAINNISDRRQRSFGANVEWSTILDTDSSTHNVIAGASYLQGNTNFNSAVEIAGLNVDRSTFSTGLFDLSSGTQLRTESDTASLYLSDTIQLGDRWEWVISARYNTIDITSEDLSGFRPALNAQNRFSRLNLGAGSTLKLNEKTSAYFALGQSTRSPSPVELACSEEDAPCILPNTFLADPPLEQVVSTTFEFGLKGLLKNKIDWQVGAFHITNKDDIIFQTTGGVSSNVGFFDNVSDTRRVGIEARLAGSYNRLDWYMNYTYLKATFEDSFISSSPNHPLAIDGGVQVDVGDSLPSLPDHNLSVGLDYAISEKFSVGVQADFVSGQYLRGDEANLLDEIDSYSVVDMKLRYRVSDVFSLGLEMENVFDTEYDSFGLFGEPDEIFESFSNPIFLSSSAPRGAWVSASYRW